MLKWDSQNDPNYMRPVTREIRERPLLIPRKYDRLLKTKRQIPMRTIKNFVFVADKSFDNRISY